VRRVGEVSELSTISTSVLDTLVHLAEGVLELTALHTCISTFVLLLEVRSSCSSFGIDSLSKLSFVGVRTRGGPKPTSKCCVSLSWMVMQGEHTGVYPGSGKRRPYVQRGEMFVFPCTEVLV
jgi:hypothetical protein